MEVVHAVGHFEICVIPHRKRRVLILGVGGVEHQVSFLEVVGCAGSGDNGASGRYAVVIAAVAYEQVESENSHSSRRTERRR